MMGIDPTGADLFEKVVMRHKDAGKDGPTMEVTRRQARIWKAKGYVEVADVDVSTQVQFPPEGEPTPAVEAAASSSKGK